MPYASLKTEPWVILKNHANYAHITAQFAKQRKRAEKEYRGFVVSGIGEEKLWTKVKGQSILGEADFVEELIGYVIDRKDMVNKQIGLILSIDYRLSENRHFSRIPSHKFFISKIRFFRILHSRTT